jgi:hypothetical protein
MPAKRNAFLLWLSDSGGYLYIVVVFLVVLIFAIKNCATGSSEPSYNVPSSTSGDPAVSAAANH